MVAVACAAAACGDAASTGDAVTDIDGGATPYKDGGTSGTTDIDGSPTTDIDAGHAPDGAPLPPPLPAHGLSGEYFDDFTTSALTRTDPKVDFTWTAAPGPGLRAESYSVRWTGTLTPQFSETYSLTTTSDDGVRLYVDGKLLVDHWDMHAASDDTKTVDLVAGKAHDLRLEYFQYMQGARIALAWSSKSQPKEIVPTAALAPKLAAPPTKGPRPSYTNAVVGFDCPDPGVLRVDGAPATYYMACTGGSFPIRTSNDLVTWKDTGAKLLPGGVAPWAGNGGRNWAPELHKAKTQYVAYYTAVDKTNRLCIGAAHAASPTGPWVDRGTALVRDANLGAIDAHFFADDDGKQYLYWKLDGNAVGQPTPILVQQLADDGMSFAAGTTPREVLRNDPATWEGGVVEAPWVIRRGAMVFLFYSGNVYDERYRTGVARSTSPLGPFTKKGAPILNNDADWVGPGHGSVVVAHGADFFFHHAWPTNGAGVRNDAAGRWDLLEPIVYAGGWPTFAGNASASGPLVWP